ncbi:hypothetical protein TI39_contig4118g00004 [Zymoseptoria brevis]|uniref:Uncharacterized protein n=1 Tax=Zymoseptoria brevis TaxID=1047168 RepID=A0A0F4GEE6_9PEZI|nr:hypothetical protein TI39_contig4118g00004 [Zymoseptoria brevis]
MFPRRLLPTLVACSILITILVYAAIRNGSWAHLPEAVGLGEKYGSTEEQYYAEGGVSPQLRPAEGNGGKAGFEEPKVESISPYPEGKLKPPGSTYTKCLVVPKLLSEYTGWIEDKLGDMLKDKSLTTAVYTVDDKKATLRPPKNKGHEVMVYLSYIIDFYDNLADVNIFIHSHQKAWHNNELLGLDSAEAVRHLQPERVLRDGYMNLRCHWDPGCPAWLHPGVTEQSYEKPEEVLLGQSWAEIFPGEPIPTVLSQPCCAQFAVSKDRILALPKARYIHMRNWVLRTDLTDYLSGRVFEYVWQYIFTASPIHCPSMSACYCDGYGICFGGPKAFDHWFEMRYQRKELMEDLRLWQEKARRIEDERKQSDDGKMPEEARLDIPQLGMDKELQSKISALTKEMEKTRNEAIERGKDPKQRELERTGKAMG